MEIISRFGLMPGIKPKSKELKHLNAVVLRNKYFSVGKNPIY
jgi:hypothetical protein